MKGDERMKDYIPRHIRKIVNLDHQKIDKEMPLQMLPTNLEDINLELASPELRQCIIIKVGLNMQISLIRKIPILCLSSSQ